MSQRNELKIKMLDAYNEGLIKYRARDFTGALQLFDQVLAEIPKDGPSILYKERCELYIKEPPPADWDGVFVMTTK